MGVSTHQSGSHTTLPFAVWTCDKDNVIKFREIATGITDQSAYRKISSVGCAKSRRKVASQVNCTRSSHTYVTFRRPSTYACTISTLLLTLYLFLLLIPVQLPQMIPNPPIPLTIPLQHLPMPIQPHFQPRIDPSSSSRVLHQIFQMHQITIYHHCLL